MFLNIKLKEAFSDGDWGLGIGDWGFGGWAPNPTPPTPTPKPQTPKSILKLRYKLFFI